MKAPYYSISEHCSEEPAAAKFFLHNHDEYEVLLFLEGDAKYVVEENTYTLEPCDIILIRKHEMHRVFHNSNTRYRRIVLMIAPEFFREHQCTEYETQFVKAPAGTGNKIPGDIVRSCGLYDAFLRYKAYSDNFTQGSHPVLQATLTEILYLLNQVVGFSSSESSDSPLKSVIRYLNNRYTEDISLDLLEEKFYLSKYHLCRKFRKATGLTIHEYIRRKRLTRARELCTEGKSITEAALEVGFHDYSSFYRAYLREYGNPPGRDLRFAPGHDLRFP